MKTIMNNFKTMVITLTAAFSLSFTTITLGNNEKDSGTIQYVGKDKNLPVFRLVLNTDQPAAYEIKVIEENGTVLFSETIEGKNISKIYKLDTEDSDLINGTRFEVTNKATNNTTVYRVSKLSASYTDVAAAKKVKAEKINAELQFVGNEKNQPVYRLVINNDEQTSYSISIAEENGNVLYTENIKGKKISKLYKLAIENKELANGTTFEITNKTNNTTSVYKVGDVSKPNQVTGITKL